MCVACHVADWTDVADYDPLNVQVPDWAPPGMVPPVYTDFTYDNLGVPKNPENPFYGLPPALNPDGKDFVDYGLGPIVGDEDENGKVKVMTLRNIGITGPYMHNGYFNTLEGVVHFYNTRDVKDPCPGPYTEAEALAADCWPAPEVPVNVNEDELGDLGLTPEEEAAIVEFMKTLTD
jgi:cytochrome c peroxidase